MTLKNSFISEGIISKGIGGFYYVKTNNNKIYECTARGIFRKDGLTPLPGDYVVIKITDHDDYKGAIEQIKPRHSLLTRPAVANVDQIIMVIAAKSPDPDFILLDKLLITASKKNLKVLICINKIDLDLEEQYIKIKNAYENIGHTVIAISSKENSNIDDLIEKLSGHISVMAGQSGVGKSTILNNIIGAKSMEIGDISEKIARGKHTTRHAQLFELITGGYIVDTPGFSMFELSEIKSDDLHQYYPEFNDTLGMCKFRSCSHITEPGCAIRQKVDCGEIDFERYQRYIQIYNTLKLIKEY